MTPDQHLDALLAIAPPGRALPRHPGSRFQALLRPMAAELSRIDGRAETLLRELDPRLAEELLTDYERVLGDDPCLGPAAGLPLRMRQDLAHSRWTAEGGGSPRFLVDLAARFGVQAVVQIGAPFECGAGEAGAELMDEGGWCEWVLSLPAISRIEFEAGVAEAGSPLGDFLPSPVECLARRYAPAHVLLFVSYTLPGLLLEHGTSLLGEDSNPLWLE